LLLLPLVVTIIVMTAMRRENGQGSNSMRKELNLMQEQTSSGELGQTAPSGSTQMQKGPSQSQNQMGPKVASSTDDTCSCPEAMSENPCSVEGGTVLGGVDFVQYFTTFRLSDGTYNESNVGEVGSSDYSSTYGGFSYYFLSEDNKAMFDESPTSYIPQWGGFCSWGIGDESCPPYPWAADCLGPSGNWGHWTIQNEKLYFFLFEAAKEKFMADPDVYIASGDSRWGSWFSDPYAQMSTHCFATDPSATSVH